MAIKKITVLYGGQSSEREVSLESGKDIYHSLKALGYEVQLIDYPKNFFIEQFSQEDFIFIALHGADGESGELQKILQQKRVLFSGSDHKACMNTWNKNTCKNLLKKNNIPTPKWINVSSLIAMQRNLEDDFFDLLRPFKELFLKPAEDGSSIDVFKISNNKDLELAIESCINSSRAFIFEENVDFKELTVPILNGRCLPAVEIRTSESFYNFNAKYVNKDTQLLEFILPNDKKNELEEICLKTMDVMGCRGWLRVDLLQDKNNNFYVLEVNTVPGMTEKSIIPQQFKAANKNLKKIIIAMINEGLK